MDSYNVTSFLWGFLLSPSTRSISKFYGLQNDLFIFHWSISGNDQERRKIINVLIHNWQVRRSSSSTNVCGFWISKKLTGAQPSLRRHPEEVRHLQTIESLQLCALASIYRKIRTEQWQLLSNCQFSSDRRFVSLNDLLQLEVLFYSFSLTPVLSWISLCWLMRPSQSHRRNQHKQSKAIYCMYSAMISFHVLKWIVVMNLTSLRSRFLEDTGADHNGRC